MTDNWGITGTDMHDLLGVLKPAPLPAGDPDIFYAEVLIGLRELIPCEDITFQLMDVAEQRQTLLFVTDEGVQRAECVGVNDDFQELYWQEFWEKGGCAGPLASGDYSTLLEQADICSPHLWADTPLGAAYAALGIKDHIVVPMTPLRGIDRRLGLWRHKDRPDFSERDKALLALVRPHLAELHVRRDRDLWGEPCLTPRQWEVLRHVSRGAGNTQIAHSLGVSESTVGKHLENAYMRLGVQCRTEAVAAVLPFLDVA